MARLAAVSVAGGVTGWWHSLVIDCPRPREFADFYAQPLGLTRLRDTGDHVEIGEIGEIGVGPAHPRLVFQRVEDYRPPRRQGNEFCVA